MNTDIRIEIGFTRHRKTRLLKESLGPEAVLCLLELWEYTALNRPTGYLKGYDDQDIAAAAGWPVETARTFCDALRKIRWLDGESGNHAIHEWPIHQPYVVNAPKRREASLRANKVRWKDKKTRQLSPQRMLLGDPPCLPPSPSPSLTQDLIPSGLISEVVVTPQMDERVAQKPRLATASSNGRLDHQLEQMWLKRYPGGSWSKKDFICANAGIKACGSAQGAIESFTAYLDDPDDYFRGHYPGKWASEPMRWPKKSPTSTRPRSRQMTDAKGNLLFKLDRSPLREDEIYDQT